MHRSIQRPSRRRGWKSSRNVARLGGTIHSIELTPQRDKIADAKRLLDIFASRDIARPQYAQYAPQFVSILMFCRDGAMPMLNAAMSDRSLSPTATVDEIIEFFDGVTEYAHQTRQVLSDMGSIILGVF